MNKRSKTATFGTVTRQGHDSSDFYGRNIYKDSNVDSVSKNNNGSKKGGNKKTKEAPIEESKENPPEQLDIIHCRDSRDMSHLPDSSVHLMITSPPYNVGKDYDEDLSLAEYKDLLSAVLAETHRVLDEGGRACINIANIGRSPYIPLHAALIEIALAQGFLMRGEIIWDKGASAGSSCAWGSWKSASNPVLRDVHEYILIFSKGQYQRKAKGENSISRDSFLENTKSLWRFSATSAKKAKHPAPFPVELPLRLIELYSFVGDIILDPFIGSGTTAEAALRAGRYYVGYEKEKEYVEVANERIERVQNELMQLEMPATNTSTNTKKG